MSLRDSAPFADATSVLRPYDVSVPEGDIPMVEPGNSFPGRPWRRDAAGILDRPAIHIRFANGILSVAGADGGHRSPVDSPEAVAGHRGSISAEHGLGQLKPAESAHYKSPVELALMRSLKTALDPQGIMNPGKVLPPAAAAGTQG